MKDLLRDPHFTDFVSFIACLLALVFLMAISGCAKPKLTDVMPKDGVRCKAEIAMPDELPRGRESIEVKVRIFDCVE